MPTNRTMHRMRGREAESLLRLVNIVTVGKLFFNCLSRLRLLGQRTAGASKFLLPFFVFILPGELPAQTLKEGWSPVYQDVNGKWFQINLNSLAFIGDPLALVSFAIHEQGAQGYYRWELLCKDQRLVHQGISVSVASEANTVRKRIFDGLCGFKDGQAEWTLVGSTRNSAGGFLSFVFFNRATIRSADRPFIGRSVEWLLAEPSDTGFKSTSRGEAIYDCSSIGRVASKEQGRSAFTVSDNVPTSVNTFAHSTGVLVCSENFYSSPLVSPSQRAIVPRVETPSDLLNSAQKSCQDLGFKKGTEKFGECVLRLSR